MIILLQVFSKVWIVVAFKWNQDYIAKVLCINRDKPEKHCNGQCVLMKRIKLEEEQHQKQIPFKFKEQQEFTFFFEDKCGISMNQTPALIPQKMPEYFSFLYADTFVSSFFHPPNDSDRLA